MKRVTAVVVMLMMIVSLVGCSSADQQETSEERAAAVKVLEIKESQKPVTIKYIGTVDAKEITAYSFKVGGKVKRIYVEKGDHVTEGTCLAEIDTQDLEFQVAAAKATMDTAALNIKKAEDSLRYNKDLFEKMDSLYTAGAISKDQYDQAKLQTEVTETSYYQAKSQYDAAKTDYEYKTTLIQDAKLYAQQKGTVVDVLFEENERANGGQSVATVRSGEQVINVGIPQQDLKAVQIGAKVLVDVDGETTEGIVTYIAEAPDTATRTYHAEIEVAKKDFRLGAIAKAEVAIGEQQGIWIPMTAVFSNGEDYVYIVKESRAFKRTIEILNVNDDKVRVSGIAAGELLAINGMKNLNDGSKVSIVE
ncbi:RND family efflux transporter MFP subunit [Anaerosolibacter carboniphilus]|uniref:RND family efflux transporter MFP subunit n=1 Tax=Anaerosolibacter carboniphilus TaxID=1417629 RepID=A0A841KUX0_9FIRM|nr:efflux RND transporter periplasmic adaptor subunit [Anaerosolibacter carboniphilus]MBB6213969.1 RND family efflux transporter MFP subunit [Anaerosolibacter carboniphilus]